MIESKPVISIGMPVYNCERTIQQAIRSIQNQSFPSWELIILDDGSRDKTAEVAQSVNDPRIRVYRDGVNRQLPVRLNQAVGLARGQYFARMDGDDISFPQRLEIQMSYLRNHPEVDLLGGSIVVFRSDGSVSWTSARTEHKEICGSWWSGFHLCHPTWIAETEWFRKHPYRPEATCTQDRELLLRTHRESRFAAVPEVILGYRQDSFPLSKIRPMRLQYARALWRDHIFHREVLTAAGSVIAELSKLGIDVIAESSGLNYRKKKAAQTPVAGETRAAWMQVWGEVNTA